MDEKKVFLGFSLNAPWPHSFPKAKLITEQQRHITLVFLGNYPVELLQKQFSLLFDASISLAPVGILDRILFLPQKHKPRVVAYHACFWEKKVEIFQKSLFIWSKEHVDAREIENRFLPHVSVGRNPENLAEWEQSFIPLPFQVCDFCLFESLGNSSYNVLEKKSLLPAFEELSHTADIAFLIRGEDIQSLFMHAQVALFFCDPSMIPYKDEEKAQSLDDIIRRLNAMIAKADMEVGSSFKAVSYHGVLKEEEGKMLWEMIIDV
jgi:RNA 2',3'-cyclic 3'-phosphodiesterase